MNGCCKILVADDDHAVLERYRELFGVTSDLCGEESIDLLDDFMESLGGKEGQSDIEAEWDVTLVEQGLDAVHQAQLAKQQETPITHAFLDMRMPPGMDGLQVACRMREIDPTVEIVFVSAYFDYVESELNQALGEQWHFVQKPFSDTDIFKLLPNKELSK